MQSLWPLRAWSSHNYWRTDNHSAAIWMSWNIWPLRHKRTIFIILFYHKVCKWKFAIFWKLLFVSSIIPHLHSVGCLQLLADILPRLKRSDVHWESNCASHEQWSSKLASQTAGPLENSHSHFQLRMVEMLEFRTTTNENGSICSDPTLEKNTSHIKLKLSWNHCITVDLTDKCLNIQCMLLRAIFFHPHPTTKQSTKNVWN